MNRRSRLYRSGLMSGLGAIVIALAFFAAPTQQAGAAGCTDCWIVTPTGANPVTVSAGTSETYSFTVANNDPNETLQTLTFTAPAGFTITSATGPTGTTLSALPASSVTLTLPSNAGNPFTVAITASASCTAGSGTWALSSTDSLDTNEAQWSSSPLSVSVTGNCSLAFANEPASTTVNTAITAINSQGGPVKVEVLDGSGKLDTASGAEVSVAIGPNSGPGILSGTVMVPVSGGIASFSNLSINQPGGYSLVATSTGITSATSNGFTIYNSRVSCTSSPCSASASSATTSGTVTTSSAPQSSFIAASAGGYDYTCSGVSPPFSDAFSFTVLSAGGTPLSIPVTATQRIPKSFVQSTGHTGTSGWEICYASTTPFTALPGTSGTVTIGGVTYNTGLLPNCTSTQGAPCVHSRTKNMSGDVVLTYFAFGDPSGRGAW